MPADHVPLTSPDWLSPDSVAHVTFATAFRGYDPDQVRAFLARVAELLRAAEARESELRAQIEAAERDAKSAPAELDMDQLTAALGEETARVLSAAREAATGIRAKAEDSVATMLREAQDEATRVRSDAEAVLAQRSDEAEAAAAEVRHQAEQEATEKLTDAERRLADAVAEAERLRLEASEEAARIRSAADLETGRLQAAAKEAAAAEIEEARRQGREAVAEAHVVRERVLKDLARKRKAARVHLEQLRAGRDRLLAAYTVVRRTLDEVTSELAGALSEAKHAAEAAARRVNQESEDVELLEAELATAKQSDAPLLAGVRAEAEAAAEATAAAPGSDGRATPAADAPVETAPADAASEPAPSDAASEATTDATVELGTAAVPPTEPEPLRLPPRRDRRGLFRHRRPSSADELPGGELVPLSPGDPVEEVRLLLEESEPVGGVSGEAAAESEQPIDVHELFERLKAEEAAEAAEVEEAADDGEAAVTPEPPADVEPTAAAPGGDEDVEEVDAARAVEAEAPAAPDSTELLERRDALTDDVEHRLARQLKRVMADEQNEVLDRLRRQSGSRVGASVDTVLPPRAEHPASYVRAAESELAEAAAAGHSFYGGNGTAPGAMEALADELAASIVGRVRERIEGVVRNAAGDEDAMVDGVRACYREWKTQHLGESTRDVVLGAFTRGLFAALPDGTHVRWLVDDGGAPCPDCDDNALAGALAKGEEFPTGHPCPPAHPGCRCLLVPTDE